MRSFGSLLKAGYAPRNGSWLWQRNEDNPIIQFQRFNFSASQKTPVFKPYDVNVPLVDLYIHPYFPNKPVLAIKIIKSFPYGRVKMIHYLHKGVIKLSQNIQYSEEEIYQYPTFFKPIYRLDGQ